MIAKTNYPVLRFIFNFVVGFLVVSANTSTTYAEFSIRSDVWAKRCNYQSDGTLDPINNMVVELNYVAFPPDGKTLRDYAYFLERCLTTGSTTTGSTTTTSCHVISREFPGICLENSCGRSDDATAAEFDGFFRLFWRKGSNEFKVKLRLRKGHFEGTDKISFRIKMREKTSTSTLSSKKESKSESLSVTKETYAECSSSEKGLTSSPSAAKSSAALSSASTSSAPTSTAATSTAALTSATTLTVASSFGISLRYDYSVVETRTTDAVNGSSVNVAELYLIYDTNSGGLDHYSNIFVLQLCKENASLSCANVSRNYPSCGSTCGKDEFKKYLIINQDWKDGITIIFVNVTLIEGIHYAADDETLYFRMTMKNTDSGQFDASELYPLDFTTVTTSATTTDATGTYATTTAPGTGDQGNISTSPSSPNSLASLIGIIIFVAVSTVVIIVLVFIFLRSVKLYTFVA